LKTINLDIVAAKGGHVEHCACLSVQRDHPSLQ